MLQGLRLLLCLLLLSAYSLIIAESFNPCLYNREDVLPCRDHYHHGIVSPRANQYTVHATRFRRGPSGLPICVKRKEGEMLNDIEDLGTPRIKFIFSPGAERSPQINYVNQIIAEYNVQCEPGTTTFIQFDALDLEPHNCYDGRQMKCQDYIEIDAEAGGTTEYCGNNLPSQPFIVGTGNFKMKLRTSFFISYSGFRVFVTCFNASEDIDPDTCTNPGGSLRKRAAMTLVDLCPQLETRHFEEVSLTRSQSRTDRPASLTSAEFQTLTTMAESLFRVAFSQARHKITSWPPASYLRNDPGDILDISQLDTISDTPIALSQTQPPTHPSPSPIRPRIPTREPYPLRTRTRAHGRLIEVPDHTPARVHLRERLHQHRYKRTLQRHEVSRTVTKGLYKEATLDALRYENACSPIVRSVTKSYISVARRLEPAQLERAREVYREELTLTSQSREDFTQGQEHLRKTS